MPLKSMTQEEFEEHYEAVMREQDRRDLLKDIPQKMTALTAAYLVAEGSEPGKAWKQPTTPANTYPKDWVVSHAETSWVSTVDNNVWEPGVANWREVREDGGVPEWRQPTQAKDAYHTGDQVMFEGEEWTSSIDDNTWSPAGYPAGWDKKQEE